MAGSPTSSTTPPAIDHSLPNTNNPIEQTTDPCTRSPKTSKSSYNDRGNHQARPGQNIWQIGFSRKEKDSKQEQRQQQQQQQPPQFLPLRRRRSDDAAGKAVGVNNAPKTVGGLIRSVGSFFQPASLQQQSEDKNADSNEDTKNNSTGEKPSRVVPESPLSEEMKDEKAAVPDQTECLATKVSETNAEQGSVSIQGEGGGKSPEKKDSSSAYSSTLESSEEMISSKLVEEDNKRTFNPSGLSLLFGSTNTTSLKTESVEREETDTNQQKNEGQSQLPVSGLGLALSAAENAKKSTGKKLNGEMHKVQDVQRSPSPPSSKCTVTRPSALTTLLEAGSPNGSTKLKGKCLTTPATPDPDNEKDNVEGNLIVYEGDVFAVRRFALLPIESEEERKGSARGDPRLTQSMKDSSLGQIREGRVRNLNGTLHDSLTQERSLERDDSLFASSSPSDGKPCDYHVLGLLGQGTFAQVFLCLNKQTGEEVAVKVVKNKPAYTRQAAVEVDIFKTLLDEESNKRKTKNGAEEDKSSWITLKSYFFHQSHLCLEFELLGLNLYELLKRRQFRGMRLAHVRGVLRQSLEAMRELAKKGIVHCDMKPENILVVERDTPNNESTAVESSGSNSGRSSSDTEVSQGNYRGSGTPSSVSSSSSAASPAPRIKVIDFGSATYEEPPANVNALLQEFHYQYHTHHTYIQSRFYRSPEVLVGLPYDSAIDMWSLGCVAAELFLGLPILPGMQEHDQLCRIWEMISPLPNWMMERGSKRSKYFVKSHPLNGRQNPVPDVAQQNGAAPRRTAPQAPGKGSWKLKSRGEYAATLQEETGQRLDQQQQQPTNRYFKRTELADIVLLHGSYGADEEVEVKIFCHFLKGLLDPDPWKRWTAQQALAHPFITGKPTCRSEAVLNASIRHGSVDSNDKFWSPPFDPAVCRRRLLYVEKSREKHASQLEQQQQKRIQAQTLMQRRGIIAAGRSGLAASLDENAVSTVHPERVPVIRAQETSPEVATTRMTAMTDAMSISSHRLGHVVGSLGNSLVDVDQNFGGSSPPSNLSAGDYARHSQFHSFGHAVDERMGALRGRQQPPDALPGSMGTFTRNGLVASSSDVLDHAQPYGASGAYPAQAHHVQHLPPQYARGASGNSWMDQQVAGQHQVGAPPTIRDMTGTMYSMSTVPGFSSLPQFLPTQQTFSGVHYNAQQHISVEGDLGYALQRPGVVPGMSGAADLNQAVAVTAYAGSQMSQPGHIDSRRALASPGSLSSSLGNMSSPRRVREQRTLVTSGTALVDQSNPSAGTSKNLSSSHQHDVDGEVQENGDLGRFSGSNSSSRSLLTQQLEETPMSRQQSAPVSQLASLLEGDAEGESDSAHDYHSVHPPESLSSHFGGHSLTYDGGHGLPSGMPPASVAYQAHPGYFYATSAPSTRGEPHPPTMNGSMQPPSELHAQGYMGAAVAAPYGSYGNNHSQLPGQQAPMHLHPHAPGPPPTVGSYNSAMQPPMHLAMSGGIAQQVDGSYYTGVGPSGQHYQVHPPDPSRSQYYHGMSM